MKIPTKTIMSIYCSDANIADIARKYAVPKKQIKIIKELNLSLTENRGGGFRPNISNGRLGWIRRSARLGWEVRKISVKSNISEDMVNLIVRIDDEETE